jgi:hypothetical protein
MILNLDRPRETPTHGFAIGPIASDHMTLPSSCSPGKRIVAIWLT